MTCDAKWRKNLHGAANQWLKKCANKLYEPIYHTSRSIFFRSQFFSLKLEKNQHGAKRKSKKKR